MGNRSNGSDFPFVTLGPSYKIITCEEHVISSLILLDFVVLSTYLFGIYLFVRGETDYLFGLASHVRMCVCLDVRDGNNIYFAGFHQEFRGPEFKQEIDQDNWVRKI